MALKAQAVQNSAATKAANTLRRDHAKAATSSRTLSPLIGKHPTLVPQPAPGRPRHLRLADIAAGVRLMKISR